MAIQRATFEVGMGRLERLADMIDKSDRYNQGTFFDEGGGCCALGHWLREEYGNSQREAISVVHGVGGYGSYAEATFHLTPYQAELLFSGCGCGNAKRDGKAAADYIRKFVAALREKRAAEAEAFREEVLERPAPNLDVILREFAQLRREVIASEAQAPRHSFSFIG